MESPNRGSRHYADAAGGYELESIPKRSRRVIHMLQDIEEENAPPSASLLADSHLIIYVEYELDVYVEYELDARSVFDIYTGPVQARVSNRFERVASDSLPAPRADLKHRLL